MTESTMPSHVQASITRTGEYWVVVPDAAGNVAVLNGTGRAVFELCDGTRSPEAIARAVAAEAGADPERVRADVQAFITQIGAAGLLEHG